MALQKPILGRVSADEFIGRETELDRILKFAEKTDGPAGTILSAPPGAGISELLRQAFDHFFRCGSDVVPIYFSFDASETEFETAARRFARELLTQAVAYRRGDRGILAAAPELDELTRLAALNDVYWIDAVVENLSRIASNPDEDSLVRACFGAPVRASLAGVRLFVMIDGVHNLRFCRAAGSLRKIAELLRGAAAPFILAGRRRFFDRDLGCQRLFVETLSMSEIGNIIAGAAQRLGVQVNESTRDLIARQCGGHLAFIEALLKRAKLESRSMTSFRNAQSIYASELFGGEIGGYFENCIARALPPASAGTPTVLLEAMRSAEALPTGDWQTRLGLESSAFEHFAAVLNDCELISVTANRIEPARENNVFMDYVEIRTQLESRGANRALIFAESLSGFIKKAPALMAEYYRENAAIGLREILRQFDGQRVPGILFDSGNFKAAASGISVQEIEVMLSGEVDALALPHVVFAAHAAEIYPAIGKASKLERSAAALGFCEGESGEESEIAWLALEIESKLEVDAKLAEFWCDRLEMAAAMCGFGRFQLWLVSNEGFSVDALELMAARNCFSSNRRQTEFLKILVGFKKRAEEISEFAEYEFVMPMSDDAELIAAHTIEEIARSHNIDLKSINQIKTALIEACINAAEHGKSPDGKLHQLVRVGGGQIELTVSNRGMRLADRQSTEIEPTLGRRGWGLSLMRRLMDEVRILRVDDGTSIRMIKRFAEQPS